MFHDLTIREVRQETPDAVVICFEVPAELADTYTYQPGQYLTLRADVNGDDV